MTIQSSNFVTFLADIEFTIGAKLVLGHENSEKLGLYEAPEPFNANVNMYDENEMNIEIGKKCTIAAHFTRLKKVLLSRLLILSEKEKHF